jgi:Nitrogen regulatory protein P-II
MQLTGILDAIAEGARTGKIGDGKIFVTALEEIVRIRTGERGRAAAMIALVAATLRFADDPKPDPAGISTGDRSNVLDAGGNSFIVTAPDKSDPDYAAKKKAFDEYKPEVEEEGLDVPEFGLPAYPEDLTIAAEVSA